MTDLGELYYGARCAMQHIDPYDPSAVLREFTAAGGSFRSDAVGEEANRIGVTNCINLPTGLFLAIPFALLPWGLAQGLWVVLLAGLLVMAAWLTWDLGGSASPAVWVCLAGFVLANCELALTGGNTASIAVSTCVIAAWCFLKDRFAPVGAVLLAVGLVLKPQDAGFVWLYFLLAGGVQRKRALQTLAVAGILGVCAAIWIAPSSPHWVQELHRNVSVELVHGGISDPGPSGLLSRNTGELIDLQTAVSIFRDDPGFYNPISYALGGLLILIWAFAVLRRRFSAEDAPFALAAIAVLTLLPVYHRTYDAKLLLLTIPACALLWAEKGTRRWIALVLTSAGILVTSDIPLAILLRLTRGCPIIRRRRPVR